MLYHLSVLEAPWLLRNRTPEPPALFILILDSFWCPPAGLPTPRNEKMPHLQWKKCPKWGFYYIKTSEKTPDTKKFGIYLCFIAFLLTKENAPWLKKCYFFPKKALKMSGRQHCPPGLPFPPPCGALRARSSLEFPTPAPGAWAEEGRIGGKFRNNNKTGNGAKKEQ